MKNFSAYLLLIAGLVVLAGLTRLIPGPAPDLESFPIVVHGAVERNLRSTNSFHSEAKGQYGVGVVYSLDDNNYNMVETLFPLGTPSGVYALQGASFDAQSFYVQYVEKDHGRLRRFDRNVNGTLTLNRTGPILAGRLNFRAQDTRSADWVSVSTEFSFLSREEIAPVVRPIQIFSLPLLMIGAAVLMGVNILLAIYVTWRASADEGITGLAALLNRRAFWLAWSKPELRGVAIVWTITILAILALFVGFILFSLLMPRLI